MALSISQHGARIASKPGYQPHALPRAPVGMPRKARVWPTCSKRGDLGAVIPQAAAGGGSGAGSSGGNGGSSGGGSGGGGGGGRGSSGAGEPHRMRVWTLAYAAFLAAGGIFAFAKKGSTKSLTSAGGSALILALTARTMVGAGAKGAIAVALAISLLLTLVMARRYQNSGKIMPAGLAAGVSLLMSAAYIGSLA